jgi:hypothetical protein
MLQLLQVASDRRLHTCGIAAILRQTDSGPAEDAPDEPDLALLETAAGVAPVAVLLK